MAPHDDHTTAGGRHAPPLHTPRLRLKPKSPRSGYVDGAWWPHSDDLTAELPDLLAVLSVRLGPVGRVIYNFTEWATAPAKLAFGPQTVRLDGYRRQPVHTVEVLGLNRQRITLLVVSPHTDENDAHTVMMTAAGPNNALTVANLMISGQKVDARE
ncbi:hypothetical protein MINTM020_27650 [Mycobacterium paraintracellulare]|uniref:DUF5994 family protein n=1 Tax=Mycobacterium paraintracellulare TaxID=1138383 RepID=UPI0019383533|nr:DUF5994 family protein [Mycobacterium paraintracellulare]BCP10667.1 hypothetical protein MINTM020_27650 [Mycobacterium paraintracellulare]